MSVPTSRRLGTVVLLLVVLTGCQDRAVTGGTVGAPPAAGRPSTETRTSVSPTPAPRPAPMKPTVLWTSNDPQPLGQPVVAGQNIAVYTETNTVPYIQIMDPATGRTLWRRPTSFGGATPGVAVSPLVVAGTVVYLRPRETDSQWTQLVIADLRSGRDLSVSPEAFYVTERPDECDGEVCFVGWSDAKQQGHRVQVPSGRMTTLASAPGRIVGAGGLTSTQIDGHPEMLERQVAGKTLWSKQLSDYFGPGYSTNGGWDFAYYEKQKVLAGTVGTDDPKEVPNTELRLGRTAKMVGINAVTGVKLWTQPGVDGSCLPELGEAVAVRCRWGSSTVLGRAVKSAALAIEGFDPSTGKTTWSVAVADPTGKTWDQLRTLVKITSDGKLAVAGRGGQLLIDPASGTTAIATTTTRYVCSSEIDTQIWGQGFDYRGTPVDTSHTGTARFPCDLDGRAVALDTRWPSGVGATVGDIQVVTTPTGLQATSIPAAGSAGLALPTAAPTVSTAGPDRSAAPTARSTAPSRLPTVAATAVWTATGGVLLSQPVAAGRVALIYVWQDEQLILKAVDPATGRTVWHRRTSPGSSPNGSIAPVAVGARVVYLRGEPNRTVQVVVADADTGRDIHVTKAFFTVDGWPWGCGPDVCFTSRTDAGRQAKRIDLVSGLLDDRPPYDGSTQQQVGGDLVLAFSGQMTKLVAIDRGEAIFSVPARPVVPASYDALSSPYRAAFQLWPAAGVYVGRLSDAYDPDHPRYTRELGARSRMVAVDAQTGQVVWTTTGTNDDCLAAPFLSGTYAYPVRCRWAENAVDTYRDGSWARQNGRVTVEGFDPRTGRTTWSVALADESGPVASVFRSRAAGQDTMLANGNSGLVLISLRDGRTTPAAATQGYFCATPVDSELGVALGTQEPGSHHLWSTGFAYDWCGSSGEPAPATTGWPSWVGTQVGVMRVVLTQRGLQGFRSG